MKNTMSAILGLSLMLGSAALSFGAQDTTKPADSKTPSTSTSTPKKVKKHKKATTAAPASTPPAAPSK